MSKFNIGDRVETNGAAPKDNSVQLMPHRFGTVVGYDTDGKNKVVMDGESEPSFIADHELRRAGGIYKYVANYDVKVNRYGREEVRFMWRPEVFHDEKAISDAVALFEREHGCRLDFVDVERGRVTLFIKRVKGVAL